MTRKILSKDQVDNILNLYKSGLGETKIHNQTGISIDIIRRILRNNNITIIGTKRYQVNDNYFENIDNEEKAYWLGFLCADGYLRLRYGKYGNLRLKLSTKDISHIEKFKNSINSTNKITTKDEYYQYKGEKLKTSSTYIEIHSTKMVKDLIKHGCSENKTKYMTIPTTIPDNLIRHYIRGYFDGDGSISIDKFNNFSFYICGSSENFLKWMHDEFDKINITKQNIRKNINGVYILKICRINDLKRINDYFYNNANIFLTRKKEIFNKIENKK